MVDDTGTAVRLMRQKSQLQSCKPILRHAPLPATRISRKEQYEALNRLYVEEAERYEALNKRGLAYLTVVGALSLATIFKLDSIAAKVLASQLAISFGFLAGYFALAAVVLVAWSMRVLDYFALADPRSLVREIDAEQYSIEDTYSVLLVGLVEATEQNRTKNDGRAQVLEIALIFAVAAAILVGASSVVIFSLT